MQSKHMYVQRRIDMSCCLQDTQLVSNSCADQNHAVITGLARHIKTVYLENLECYFIIMRLAR